MTTTSLWLVPIIPQVVLHRLYQYFLIICVPSLKTRSNKWCFGTILLCRILPIFNLFIYFSFYNTFSLTLTYFLYNVVKLHLITVSNMPGFIRRLFLKPINKRLVLCRSKLSASFNRIQKFNIKFKNRALKRFQLRVFVAQWFLLREVANPSNPCFNLSQYST